MITNCSEIKRPDALNRFYLDYLIIISTDLKNTDHSLYVFSRFRELSCNSMKSVERMMKQILFQTISKIFWFSSLAIFLICFVQTSKESKWNKWNSFFIFDESNKKFISLPIWQKQQSNHYTIQGSFYLIKEVRYSA